MIPDWTIETTAGHNRVTHHAPPRFTASWASGEADRARIQGPCWTSPGSGPDDALHLFGWTWIDPQPPPASVAFERLMASAAVRIDAWIAERF